ncbi:MAG: hypothetical protein VB070_07990 [Clostridiaceae bacterium]|nr:hypothetical protein [Clostridiaceae bacterium]
MNIIKKSLITMLIVTMFIITTGFISNRNESNVFSENEIAEAEKTVIPENYMQLISNAKILGINAGNLSSMRIGKAFTITRLENKDMEPTKDIIYYPVIFEKNIVALITLIKSNNELCCTVGIDFANNLNDIVQKVGLENNPCLFSYDNSIYAIDKNNNIYNVFTDQQSQKMVNNPGYDRIRSYSNYISYNNYITIDDIQNNNYVDNVELKAENIHLLPIYPQKNQYINGSQRPVCWAATVASMVHFEMKPQYNNLTAKDVCDSHGHPYTSELDANIPSYLNYYLPDIYAPTYMLRALSGDEIKTVINNIDPAFMSSNCGIAKCHATALIGYIALESGTVSNIYIMDPATENYKICTRYNNKYVFALGNDSYTWNRTVRLLYH